MLIKKLSRILAISVIAFVAVLLWNTKSSQADESSKLLNSAAIQKIVKKGTLNVGVKQDVPLAANPPYYAFFHGCKEFCLHLYIHGIYLVQKQRSVVSQLK